MAHKKRKPIRVKDLGDVRDEIDDLFDRWQELVEQNAAETVVTNMLIIRLNRLRVALEAEKQRK